MSLRNALIRETFNNLSSNANRLLRILKLVSAEDKVTTDRLVLGNVAS